MKPGVKIAVYAVLVTATLVTGYFFFKSFGKLFEPEKPKPEPVAVVPASTNVEPDTNIIATTTPTNPPPATNIITGQPLEAANTNAATNVVAKAVEPPPKTPESDQTAATAPPTRNKSRIGVWTVSFFASIIALGGLIAWDVSTYMGSKSLRLLYNDEGQGMKTPEYEAAEQVWADGQPLEAIRLMRDYLNKNPREIHVALRIAEIYEKDLSNYLAAALEYEEVLKKKLPDERWGWSAIHLCNLYFKLDQEVKAYALLQRVVKEYGQTQAAGKARKRLAEVDPNLLSQTESAPEPEKKEAPAPEEPKSNLPPGFRPKK